MMAVSHLVELLALAALAVATAVGVDRAVAGRPLRHLTRTRPGEAGPADCRLPRRGEVPDGPVWRGHLTHDPRWDEESPRLHMPKKTRPE